MKGEFERAISDYGELAHRSPATSERRALRIDPRDFYALRFRGDAHLANGDYDRAVSDCEAALSISGPDEVAYFCMAKANLFNGNLEQAMRDFDSAVQCNPSSGRALYGRALARELTGDSEGAERDYNSARVLGYDDPE